jgi:hypothetical protein
MRPTAPISELKEHHHSAITVGVIVKATYLAEDRMGAAGVAARRSSLVCSQAIACSQILQSGTAPRRGLGNMPSWCKRCSKYDKVILAILMQKVEKDGARTLVCFYVSGCYFCE